MNFEQLTHACEQAHNHLQRTAISTVNQSLTIRNWLFGYYIVEYEQHGEDRAKYGTELLKKLADSLSSKNVKGLSDRSLRNCRQFYLVYPEIGPSLSDYALPESIWQTSSAKSKKGLKHTDFKSVAPGVLISELSFSHIIELGKGFCFEARQKRLTIDGEYYYVDLVFFHRILKCHVLIDLKTRKFQHTDAGQMNFYLYYYGNNEIEEGDNPPVGIILCTDKNSSTVKYATGSLDNQLFVSRYQIELPTVKELQEFIKRDIKLMGG